MVGGQNDPGRRHQAERHGWLRNAAGRVARGLRPRGVRTTLILLLLVALVPVVVVQAAIYYSWYQVRRDSELQANLELARSVGTTFGAFTRDVLRQELAIGISFTSSAPGAMEHGSEHLQASIQEYPSVRNLNWVDPHGRIVASSDPSGVGVDVRDRLHFQQILGGREWVVGDLVLGRISGEPTFTISRGLRDATGTLLGIAAAGVDPDGLGRALVVERTGQATIEIVDGEGRIVYRYPEANLTWERRISTADQDLLRRALAGETIAGTFPSAIDGKQQMGALAPIALTGWVVVAARPAEEAAAPVVLDLLRAGAVLLLVAVAALMAALLVGRQITGPLSRLREQALALGRGELGRRTAVDGPAELAEVATTFNQMAAEIQRRVEETARLHQAECEARSEAEHRAAEMNIVLHTISHDLRAPLTVIQGQAQILDQMLERANVSGRQQQSVRAILAGARRMNLMIQDLVDSARLELHQLQLEIAPVDLSWFLPELLERSPGVLDPRRIKLEIPDPLPPVAADPNRLERILTNLLTNALKYSPPEMEVLISARQTWEEVVISVADQGVGIASEELPHVFERFYRAKATRKTEGLGLGLYITRMMVEAHAGRIWAESAVGRGSTFSFTLPLSQVDAREQPGFAA